MTNERKRTETNGRNKRKEETDAKILTWWKKRSGLERVLTVTAICGFFLCIALVVALAVVAINSSTSKICLTSGCVNAATQILKNMDRDVEPCDDFFKFACGKFVENNVIPDDKLFVDITSLIQDDFDKQLRIILEQKSPPNELRPFTLAKYFYKACMNINKIEELGYQPLLDYLRKLGGWPVLDGERWNDGNFTWQDTVYRLRKDGLSDNYFIRIRVDLDGNHERRVFLDGPTLEFKRKTMLEGFNPNQYNALQLYYKYMVDIAVILGANRDRAEEELKQSLEFEIALANINVPNDGLPSEKQPNMYVYTAMTVNELSIIYPSIPWREYVDNILSPSRLNHSEFIVVRAPTFLKNFEELVNRTSKRVLANYALWKTAVSWIKVLTGDIRKRQLEYVTEGQEARFKNREPRSKECLGVMTSWMQTIIDSMYVRKYFKKDAKENALEMFNEIKREFVKTLKKVDWMDEETRAKALRKIHSMTSYIAYADELLDDRKLEEFFSKLELKSDDYMGSFINLSIFWTDYQFGNLRQPVNKTDWILQKATEVNAFYLMDNILIFPAAILQGVSFSKDRPRYMNYGGIGCLIAQKITNGFGYKGSKYNKEGKFVDWWQPETTKQFLKRAECMIYQYENYTEKDVNMNLNGKNTMDENISDNGGIKVAYFAYKEWVWRNGREEGLPGLPYTPEQMFWISAANMRCSKYHPKWMKDYIKWISYSPPEFRVIGSMSNIEEFARDFNCPVGSKMNPQKKCTVW